MKQLFKLMFVIVFLTTMGSSLPAYAKNKESIGSFFHHIFVMNPELKKIRTKAITLKASVTQVKIVGPFKVKVYDGALHPRVEVTSSLYHVLQMSVTQNKNQLSIMADPRAYLKAMRGLEIVVYVKQLRDLTVEGAQRLQIQTVKRSHFSLNVKNVCQLKLSGGATIPRLTLIGQMHFIATGPLYLHTICHYGNGNVRINHVLGHNISLFNEGNGRVMMNGHYSMADITNYGDSYIGLKNMSGNNVTLFNKGNSRVILNGHYSMASITSYGNSQIDLKNMSGNNVTLFNQGNSRVIMTGHYSMASITNYGDSYIDLKYMSGNNVMLFNKGNSSIILTGPYSLAKVTNYGNSRLSLVGGAKHKNKRLTVNMNHQGSISLLNINTSTLDLTTQDGAHYQLSGYASLVNINAYKHANIHAAGLMAYNAYVKTHDFAVVSIRVLHRIFAHAVGCSRIEYYGHPPYHFAEARQGSAILPMTP